VSGVLAACPEPDKALACLRAGDVLVITRLSRAMRSLKHLLALAGELRERGVGLVVLKQDIDTTTPGGRLDVVVADQAGAEPGRDRPGPLVSRRVEGRHGLV
jgi:DNA invertase Pin-like site-specific DNA recombinase